MEDFFLHFLNPIKIIVALAFCYAAFNLDRKKPLNRKILAILLVCLLTEIINSVLKSSGKSTNLSTSLSIIAHGALWLWLLAGLVAIRMVALAALLVFLIFALADLFFLEGLWRFNYYPFVAGAFLYIVIFIYESFYRLYKEDFEFFLDRKYLLLLAPVLFFFGVSFMFGFKSKEVTSSLVFGRVKLYTFIIYFVNSAYYGLVAGYVFRERKERNHE